MKQIKYVKLWNNYSDKTFEYNGKDFNRCFHDSILTIKFKLKNQGYFIAENGNDEPPMELVFKHWDDLAVRHNPAFDKANYSILEYR